MNPKSIVYCVLAIAVLLLSLVEPISATCLGALGIALYRNSLFELTTIAAGTETPGLVISMYGKAWVSMFSKKPLAGDKIAWRSDAVIEITKASGTTFADGVAVDYSNSGASAVATTTGDFALGKVRGAVGTGVTTVIVAMNQ